MSATWGLKISFMSVCVDFTYMLVNEHRLNAAQTALIANSGDSAYERCSRYYV